MTMGRDRLPPAFLSFALDGNREREHETTLLGKNEHRDPRRSRKGRRSRRSSLRAKKAILSCLIESDSSKCVARKIDIAEATVKVHVKAIMRKIEVPEPDSGNDLGNEPWISGASGKQPRAERPSMQAEVS